MEHGTQVFSAWKDFPTSENPDGRFKYFSVALDINRDSIIYNRSTYSFLDWVADVGGIFSGLLGIANIFILPVQSLAVKAAIASKLVFFRPSDDSGNSDNQKNGSRIRP